MINNRQQGGRRRGRGGQRGPNTGGQPGNRTDNRQRGNAAQLLEKYKNMARDAQLAGDRVQTEYYLQYADHYHRVLSESRSRYEDQRPQRDEFDDEDGDDEMIEAADEQVQRTEEREERPERAQRAERPERAERPDRGERQNRRPRERRPRDADDQAADGEGEDFQRAPRLNGSAETIAFDVLPPAIGREPDALDGAAADDAEPRRPRRRARAPRPADGEEEVAPAA